MSPSYRNARAEDLPTSYYAAFEAIERDPNNELVVAELEGKLVAVLQLTCVGRHLISWAIERAGEKGCAMVQLTSDKSRRDAIRFYESLGFVASHEGMKLDLASR